MPRAECKFRRASDDKRQVTKQAFDIEDRASFTESAWFDILSLREFLNPEILHQHRVYLEIESGLKFSEEIQA